MTEALKFRLKPVVPIKDGFSFYFTEKEGWEFWLAQTVEYNGGRSTQWIKMGNDGPEYLGRKIHNKQGLEVQIKSRDDQLWKQAKRYINADKDEVEAFFDELGAFIQQNQAIIYPSLGEPEDEEEKDDTNIPERFQDYPPRIQEAALEIVESPDPLQILKAGVGSVHIGDEPEIEFSILKEFTPHVLDGEPVHSRIGGITDTGKTDLVKHSLKIVPARYQQDITTLSSKALYYDTTLREDYNHIVINDFLDSPDALALIKVMTDNLADKKVHKTVIDNEGVNMEIPGRNTVTITAAKDINDPETERRFLQLNPQDDPNHTQKVKEFIRKSGVTGTVDKSLIFQICQAVFDLLTEKSLKVFNPWIEGIDVIDKGFTDIKIFINLVKARGLIFQDHRYRIDDETILGSREDVEAVARLWVQIAPLQQYKLNKKQVDLLKELPVYDPDIYRLSLDNLDDDETGSLEGVTGRTYKELTKKFKVSRGTIKRWIDGYEDKQKQLYKPGLNDLGFIIKKSSNPGNDNSPILFFLNGEKKEYVESLKVGSDSVHGVHFQMDTLFMGLNGVKKIVDLFFKYVHFSPEQREDKIFPFLEDAPIEVKTDEDVYKIICSLKEAIKTLPGSEVDPVEKILYYLTSWKNGHTSIIQENTLNDDIGSLFSVHHKMDSMDTDKKGKEDHSGSIHKTYDKTVEDPDPKGIENEIYKACQKFPDEATLSYISYKVSRKLGVEEREVKDIIGHLFTAQKLVLNDNDKLEPSPAGGGN